MRVLLPLILICIAMQILIIFTDLPHQLPSRAGKGANYSPLFLRQLTSKPGCSYQFLDAARQPEMAGDSSPINIRYLHPRPNTISSLKTAHTPCFAVVVQAVVKSKFYTNAQYDITFFMNQKQIPTEVLKYELRKMQIKLSEESRSSFLTFVKKVWPEFVAGSHHKIIAKKFEDISRGKIKRLIVNMPPRHTKSYH